MTMVKKFKLNNVDVVEENNPVRCKRCGQNFNVVAPSLKKGSSTITCSHCGHTMEDACQSKN